MRIESSNVSLYSKHDLSRKYEKTESLKMWVGNERPDFEGNHLPVSPARAAAPAPSPDAGKTPPPSSPAGEDAWEGISARDRITVLLIEAMIEASTGKKIKIRLVRPPARSGESTPPPESAQESTAQGQKKQGWGVEYDFHETYRESESTVFDAEGIIRTAEGKEMDFTARLSLSREFVQENSIRLREGDAKKIDPLVLNFDAPAARLTEEKISFDLNADGRKELVSFVGPGSGFLALDRNGDGSVTNGRELFGPVSGNGFAELSKYDEDGNGWIDEGDSLFASLRLWSANREGEQELSPLKEKGIGALYLGSLSAHFTLTDSSNGVRGEMRKAGVYLREDGNSGTIQQVDLTV